MRDPDELTEELEFSEKLFGTWSIHYYQLASHIQDAFNSHTTTESNDAAIIISQGRGASGAVVLRRCKNIGEFSSMAVEA